MTKMERSDVVRLFIISSVLTLITNFPSGFINSSINTAVDELKAFIRDSYKLRGWHLTTSQLTMIRGGILNAWFVAQLMGSLIAPTLTDKLGRKKAFIVSSITLTLSAVLQYIGSITALPELFMLGRITAGLASPVADAALILYLQESTPVNLRATFSFLGEIGYSASCCIGMILGMRSVLGYSLPRLLFFAILPGLPAVLFLLWIPETPKYLMIVRRNRNLARQSLDFFQGLKKHNDNLLDEFMLEANDEGEREHTSIKELLTTWYLRKAVLLSCAVVFLTLPFYPVLQSSTLFFQRINIENDIAQYSSTVLMALFAVACISGSFFIDRYPRRLLILLFGILATTFLTGFVGFSVSQHLHAAFKYAALGSLFLYIVFFGMVLGPVSWFVAPELVAQRHRSSMFCLCYGLLNIMIAVTNFLTVYLYDIIGAYTFIPLFIVPSCVFLICIYLYLPETFKKETHEIIATMGGASQSSLSKSSDSQPCFEN